MSVWKKMGEGSQDGKYLQQCRMQAFNLMGLSLEFFHSYREDKRILEGDLWNEDRYHFRYPFEGTSPRI
jgi:hypothetical protein